MANLVRILLILFMLGVAEPAQRHVLVFGGNGFIGSEAVERFLDAKDNVTIVNRGNWYWDSKERILPHVYHIPCDRKKDHIEHCPQLLAFISQVNQFDLVLDFSAYGPEEVNEATKHLQNKVSLYVLISTDSIYDVCNKQHIGFSKETDAIRPESKDDQETLSYHHEYGHRKLQAEEALIQQRIDGGFPFIILRLPDVFGPRDSTYRWWIYQLWLKLAPEVAEKPVTLPQFLNTYQMSLVYVEDVAKLLVELPEMGPQVNDQAINLAYSDTFTLGMLLEGIRSQLGLDGPPFKFLDHESNPFYLYPSVRLGPVDVFKAQSLLDWTPTPWEEALSKTVHFFENIFVDRKFAKQRDKVIQILGHQVYEDDKQHFYAALEKVYSIDLPQFTKKDEL